MIKRIYNPIPKAIINIGSVFSSGILCSALVAELTGKNGDIKWNEISSKTSFYIILVVMLISIPYNAYSAKIEIDYRQKLNTKFLDKFIKDQGLDTLASEINNAIKTSDKSKLSDLLDMKELITLNLEKK